MGPQRLGHAAQHALISYGCIALWVALSAGVIMFNKYILDPHLGGFPFPLTLTSVHMAFCSLVSWALIKLKLVESPPMPIDTYLRCVVPIGGLFALTLWMGNAAYLYLSVSFIQMLKASMPMLVYIIGTLLGTEQWSGRTGGVLAVVMAGVLVASYGEVVFVLVGVLCQVASLLSEATRLTLVQLLLQARGIRLNPITTMYHVSPVCLAFLVIPLALLEAERVALTGWGVGPGTLLASAAAAFGLNCAIFLLIGRTSALTMNVAGVLKDVLLICLSMSLYGSVVTELQFVGYAVALTGVFYYNYQKVQAVAAQQAKAAAAQAKSASSEGGGGGGRDAEAAGSGQGVAAAPSGGESEPMLVRGSGSRSNVGGGGGGGGGK